ncbi:hypothetical protein C0J52_22508 [Blattella germanica]|nr:hypothetical protein C0J52_22508 [Blattella germanica]
MHNTVNTVVSYHFVCLLLTKKHYFDHRIEYLKLRKKKIFKTAIFFFNPVNI